ncbi:hypothetical protein P280DRAFT_399380 [Massarina eburnea CBS 473.64]|uniref:SP-RING-type domain-containing protein n=1 Tax=Massarina eburnea CBS 473.64 TaxID=1395130 RepID=A0A6A6RZU8_9PLEO|nr:hypothetical protein P280DRAFT_399380 [Massarina eburnea CBS 473.64]
MASRYSTARPTPSRHSLVSNATPNRASSSAAAADELPPYKKPSHPLTTRAQDHIRALNGRSITLIKDQSTEAEKHITEAAGVINDKLREHEEEIAKRRKQWERGINTNSQENEEAALLMLQKKVDDMTKQLEEYMRGVIDTGVAAKRMEESLQWLHSNAPNRMREQYETQMSQRESQRQSQSQRGRRTHDSDGDEDMNAEVQSEGPTPGPTPLDGSRVILTGIGEVLSERLNSKKSEYTSQPLSFRYTENPAYVNFKGIVHDAKYQDDHPMPRPDTWFTETGSPAPGITQRGGDDDDDDIVMDRARISMRCPLTFQQFKEPLTSSKCPHTFEKNAIVEMIRMSNARVGGGRQGGVRAVECPVTGCNQMLTRDDLRHDPILIRKLQRMMKAEREAEQSELEDVDEHESLQPSTSIKREPSGRQTPATKQPPRSSYVEDLGPSSDSEDDDE